MQLIKRQYGFKKGASTETALHKLVHKIERAILNSGMALGTFLGIGGAIYNVAFHAIEKALHKKCFLSNVRTCQQMNNVNNKVEIPSTYPESFRAIVQKL